MSRFARFLSNGVMILAFAVLLLAGMSCQYRINSERFPDSPVWTRFFR